MYISGLEALRPKSETQLRCSKWESQFGGL